MVFIYETLPCLFQIDTNPNKFTIPITEPTDEIREMFFDP